MAARKPAAAPRAAPRKRKPPAPPEFQLGSGTRVPLDGDLVFLIDALYREFAVRRGFAPAYAEVRAEIERVQASMSPELLSEYITASLFLNYVTYENEMAERLAERIARRAKRAR